MDKTTPELFADFITAQANRKQETISEAAPIYNVTHGGRVIGVHQHGKGFTSSRPDEFKDHPTKIPNGAKIDSEGGPIDTTERSAPPARGKVKSGSRSGLVEFAQETISEARQKSTYELPAGTKSGTNKSRRLVKLITAYAKQNGLSVGHTHHEGPSTGPKNPDITIDHLSPNQRGDYEPRPADVTLSKYVLNHKEHGPFLKKLLEPAETAAYNQPDWMDEGVDYDDLYEKTIRPDYTTGHSVLINPKPKPAPGHANVLGNPKPPKQDWITTTTHPKPKPAPGHANVLGNPKPKPAPGHVKVLHSAEKIVSKKFEDVDYDDLDQLNEWEWDPANIAGTAALAVGGYHLGKAALRGAINVYDDAKAAWKSQKAEVRYKKAMEARKAAREAEKQAKADRKAAREAAKSNQQLNQSYEYDDLDQLDEFMD